ncbi:NADP-dependent oxidoreductase [Rhizophagus clarus]|uniref:NADP-dependent oxidoreductase n=1 Tax=Rhizophagus clarus TaxID=94130 RepID=A0A8H3KU68_9GLOM|nr:NADP-dependent oxidoreductase [Rhizophagus clarus]
MTVISNKGVILKAIPNGMPKVDEHFELVHRTIDIENLKLGENEVVLKNLYLSLDPYIHLTFEEPGPTVYGIGDLVYATTINVGWEEYSHFKSDAAFTLKHVNKELLKDTPLNYHISLFNTLKLKGLRVVGSAGSDEKIDFLLNELKFDAAFNYKKVDLDKGLSKHCPNGIDIFFDNVGYICPHSGLWYDITNPEETYKLKHVERILLKMLRIQAFTVSQYRGTDIEKDFEKDFAEWVKTGKIIYKDDVFVGIENVAKGFVDMLSGKNLGKTVVKLSD